MRFFDPGLILLRQANPPGLLNRKVHLEMEYLMVPITLKWPMVTIPSFFVKLPKYDYKCIKKMASLT